MNLLGTIIIVVTAGPMFVLCFLVAVIGMGLHALPSFFDPEFYEEIFEYILTLDYKELFEFAKEAIRAHMEMY